jgi:hypothetical protein
MSDNNDKPIKVGNPSSNEFGTMYPEVVSLEGTIRVRLVLNTGESIILPADILGLLAQNSRSMGAELKWNLEQARLAEHHPSKRYLAGEIVEPGRRFLPNAKRNGSVPLTYFIENTTENGDSTPYITWRTNEEGIHGWALGIVGVENSYIGWAAWDNPEGVDELIVNMSDVESCVAISGMMAPTETSQMSARIAAKALRSGRKLPAINNAKARAVLSAKEGILSPPEISNWAAAQIKSLTISSGDRKIPVAVAIAPPNSFPNQKVLAKEELEGLSWAEKAQLELEILEPLLDKWKKNVKETMIASGWRIVELPAPRWGYSRLENVMWFTLIEPELWSNLSAAAHESARTFSLSRSSRI